ncbi:MAG: GntR family transcriptional regulator [Gammaproteobacteria bacterium]|nr:GntR family transcriptional regulator [Gammaproteobacteria bacterium]NIM73144.1 GntR family transcriptional regulator [Gammaproteobacteria bacterium]NIN38824.1 GntR family transcriptional regulator [Gammaproteobacteria bacterium]NIO24899.1 GntR family transcriptional regulator [Gammaproteobacteria bacterium]NIO65501.1 GntR family transcriptional regulator [Gammaproteobacteria bacterium]
MQLSRIADDMIGGEVLSATKLPKYLRLSNAILNLIESGEMRPGDKLPPEGALARDLPASLGTVQKALGHLKTLGVVVRDHGRGTFVAGGPRPTSGERVPEDELLHFRFADDRCETPLPVYARVESVDKVAGSRADPSTPWARFLGADRAYVRIGRRINVNDEFEAFSQFYLPWSRFRDLLRVPLDELNGISLRVVLGRTYNMPTLTFDQRLHCASLPAAATGAMGLAPGAPGMIWEIFGRTYRRQPASYQRVFLPSGHRPIAITSSV